MTTIGWPMTGYAPHIDIISSDRGLGAVSGILAPACEVPSPAWFDDFHSRYAILTENDFAQEKELYYLPGAGLCLRKSALDGLIHDGFRSHLTGRVGKKLLSGEDTELTMALHLSGWRLRIDRRLRLQHFMPAERLRWDYLRHLERGHGASWVLLDAYSEHSLSLDPGPRRWLSERWWYQLCRTFVELGRRPRALIAALITNSEGDYSVIELERLLGRILGLLRLRRRYGAARRGARETLGIQNSRAGVAANFHTAA